jgi:hypothetical protein
MDSEKHQSKAGSKTTTGDAQKKGEGNGDKNFKSFNNFKKNGKTPQSGADDEDHHIHQKDEKEDRHGNKDLQSNKRFEELYKLNEKMLKVKESRAKELEDRMNKIDEECTFQPNILPSSKKVIEEQYGMARGGDNQVDFYERKKEWKIRQEEKINRLQEKEMVKESEKCTFKPQIEAKTTVLKSKPHIEVEQNDTTKKFLERQAKARQQNDEKKKALCLRSEYTQNDKKDGKDLKKAPLKVADDFVRDNILSKPFSDVVLNLHALLNSIEPKSYAV